MYMPALLPKDANMTHVDRKSPPKSDAMLENDPSSHVVQCGELNTVAPNSGVMYVRATRRTEINIARGYVRPGLTTSPPNTDMPTAPVKFQKSVLIKVDQSIYSTNPHKPQVRSCYKQRQVFRRYTNINASGHAHEVPIGIIHDVRAAHLAQRSPIACAYYPPNGKHNKRNHDEDRQCRDTVPHNLNAKKIR
ncbi:unnamed protein product [Phytophthora fragariaefolia]|uniref:Unnamed protein product n=1 Tax=Phytophthora fragariaefolia TaxID=1490495 RepID=A0A9W6X7L6_9STRA|nr:unnamed protein product [Phytophthora fragariaefolia]